MDSGACLGPVITGVPSRISGEPHTSCREGTGDPTPVLLPGESQRHGSLVGCSPWVAKSQTRLSGFTFTFHFHALEKEMTTHSSVLVWRIPVTMETSGLPSME